MRHVSLALVLFAAACSKSQPATDAASPPATQPAEAKPAETKPAETKPPEVKPAETKPEETKPPEVKAAGGSREATCKELGDKSKETLAALTKKLVELGLPDRPEVDPKGVGECVTDESGKGAWILTLERAEATRTQAPPEEPEEFQIRRIMAFVHVAEDGTTQRWEPLLGDDAPFNLTSDRLFNTELLIGRVFDWDGDGVVDLAARMHHRGPDQDDTSFTLVRAKDGTADVWEATDRGAIREIADGDGDGRPDLLLLDPFAWGVRGDTVPGTVRFILRATGTGFASDDDGVKAYYKKACGDTKVEVGAAPKSEQEGDVMDQLVCARLWGASVKEVQAKLDAFMKKTYESEPHPLDDPDSPPFMTAVPVQLQ